jgi:ankyrin repeat protein
MDNDRLLDLIAKGRTDLVIDLLARPGGSALATAGRVTVLQWLIHYGDVTGLHAAFSGFWKAADFLIEQGADPDWRNAETGETVLHAALYVRDHGAGWGEAMERNILGDYLPLSSSNHPEKKN